MFCARLWIRTLLVRCSLEIFEYERSHLVHVSADQKEDVTEYIRKGQSRGSRKLASWLLNTVPAYFFLRIVEPLSFTIFFPLLGRYSYSQRWENKGSQYKHQLIHEQRERQMDITIRRPFPGSLHSNSKSMETAFIVYSIITPSRENGVCL